MPADVIPIAYAFGMLAGGAGSLLFGKLYDHVGLKILLPLTLLGVLFAPLAFLGGYGAAVAGVLVWGLSFGVHGSVMPAAVASMIPAHRRGSAYGVFNSIFGVAWFAGSALEGWLYDHSVPALVAVAVVAQLAALGPLGLAVRSQRIT